ncbi:polysaccharide deacetylase [Umezawaea sp. Da 62-37]|uniref:polysaccharide deacetylase n=1 Tax=Umezawaea sp. Da 62-37 TaxID=3075927 RepID=UPI0028F73522|nr:polysaccharide deacetylase [Umezawaea sp. Da 62-37]WNV82322.1 polysaccharide deacetylase [Umezawaea sp. Da 62-37]
MARNEKRLRWVTTGVALGITVAVLVTIGRTPDSGGPAPENVAAGLPAPPRAPVITGDVPVVPPPAEPRADWMHKLGPNEKPPQFVMFSFDGAASKQHWDRVLPIARDTKAHVTGMLSGVYMLTDNEGMTYQGPGHDRGDSAIDFGGTKQDVNLRIGYLNDAIAAGHEIGTHYNGHFCKGEEPSVGTWNTDQWNNELDQFFAIIEKAKSRGFTLDPTNIRGGRTPCLEADWKAAFPAMKAHGLVYDTSHVSLGVTWPTVIDGVYEFPLPEVKVPALNKQAVMMDFNLWSVLNGAKEQPERAAEFSSVVVDTYRDVYRTVFNGNRAPLTIGNHFNEWAGGAFADAVEKFMGEVCVQKDTVCATYTEVIQWMQLQDPTILAQLRSFPAARN